MCCDESRDALQYRQPQPMTIVTQVNSRHEMSSTKIMKLRFVMFTLSKKYKACRLQLNFTLSQKRTQRTAREKNFLREKQAGNSLHGILVHNV